METGAFKWGFLDYVLVLGGLVTAAIGVVITSPWLALTGLAIVAVGMMLWERRRRRR